MKMNKLLNLIAHIYELWSSGKVGKIGFGFVSTGLALLAAGGNASFSARYSDAKRNIGVTGDFGSTDYFLYGLGVGSLLLGTIILLNTYKKISSEQVLMYFANTLKHGDSKAPTYAMKKDDRVNAVDSYLEAIDTYNKDEVIDDYKHNLKLFKNRTEHKEMQKIYVAALGSTPYLYLLGTLIRNGHIKSEVLDYSRDKDKWYRLEPIGDELTHVLMNETHEKTINEKLEELCRGESGAVGIALSYTYEVHKSSLPEDFQNNTLYLTHVLGFGNDKLSDKPSQASLLNELSVYIDRLKSANKKIHLFVSAQASICINLGKRYQDNTMGEVCIHNFNGANRVYDWYITFNKDKVA